MTHARFECRNLQKRRGFSLIELVLVTAILSVVGITVYSALASGIRIWQRITAETAAEDIGLFFEKISGDLRNTFNYKGIRFRGTGDTISFPGLVRASLNKERKETVGEISYTYRPVQKTIERMERNYSEIYRDRQAQGRPLVNEIDSLDFQYYYYDLQSKEFLWAASWQTRDQTFGVEEKEDILPLAVRIVLGTKENESAKTFTKTVWIPAGCCPLQPPKQE